VKITCKFFALLRDRVGAAESQIDLNSDATVADAVETVAARFPDVREVLKTCAVALNQEYANPSTKLNEGDVLAIIPPVSGG
jgi:molybdopterin converting factor subunit 1